MVIDKLVIRLKDKKIMKGKTSNFSSYKKSFDMDLLSGKVVKVHVEKLKAAFIVHSFKGDKSYTYTYEDVIPEWGSKVKVEFIDGEVMIGYNPFDLYEEHGFFLYPADLLGNNKCVFIVNSATKKITFI